MTTKERVEHTCGCGRIAGHGRAVRQDDQQVIHRSWFGWTDDVAHPDAGQGGGGPGRFTSAGPLAGADEDLFGDLPRGSTLPHPRRPGPVSDAAAEASGPKKNAPPATVEEEFDLLTRDEEFVKIAVKAKVKADGSSKDPNTHAVTDVSLPGYDLASAFSKDNVTVSSFTKKFTWKGTVVIRTLYGPGVKAQDLSCSGRGTTQSDVQNGDITLGFHESCHRADYLRYLRANPLPAPPKLEIGMTMADFNKDMTDFVAAFDAYHPAMKADSEQNTDEIGHKLSTVEATDECYLHGAP